MHSHTQTRSALSRSYGDGSGFVSRKTRAGGDWDDGVKASDTHASLKMVRLSPATKKGGRAGCPVMQKTESAMSSQGFKSFFKCVISQLCLDLDHHSF